MPDSLDSPAFVFDLDGTLVDTAPDLLITLNTILSREGRSPLEAKALRHLVGHGARVLIAQAFAMTGAAVDPQRLESLFDFFLKDYAGHVAAASRPYPGVVETLQALKTGGVRMGVLTNKPQEPTQLLLRALDLERYVGAVFAQGRRPYLKPDPRLFDDVMAELGGRGAGAIMVGDSITDVETARAAKVPVVLVSYGYTPEPVHSLGADAVIDDFRKVPEVARLLLNLP